MSKQRSETPPAPNHNPNRSFEVTQPPRDGVSSLSFSPNSDLLVATSWDSGVRLWEIKRNDGTRDTSSSTNTITSTTPKALISHDKPVLCSTWNHLGTQVFSGGTDCQVKMWSLDSSASQPITVAMHDAPIRNVAFIPHMNLLLTGSWDCTLKYWDCRQQNPVHTQQLPDRCFSLSVRHPMLVVATANRHIIVFHLQNPQTEYKRMFSPLQYQTRCVTAFPDAQGFLVGSIEGKVAAVHVEDSQRSKDYTFKCHRDDHTIYSVNSINFHPVYNTFATTGSDGVVNFWDKDSQQNLKTMARCSQAIPCSTFNNDGSIFAYSVCYDWSRGAEAYNPATAKTCIFLHRPQDSDVKLQPKPKRPPLPEASSSSGKKVGRFYVG